MLLLLPVASCAHAPSRPPEPLPDAERPLGPILDRDVDRRPRRGGRGMQTVETVQVRPFYYRRTDADGTEIDVLGPLVRWREDEVYRRLQVLPNIFYTARIAPEGDRRWLFVFLPLLWLGHDDLLVFPVAGRSRGFFGIDDFFLATWAYARARWNYGPADAPVAYTEHHVFWPLLGWGRDDAGERSFFRLAPFYGRKVGRNGVRSGFFAWPFYTWRRGPDSRTDFLFPFYGRSVGPTRTQVTVLFPFYHRSEDYLTGDVDTALWPFWRRATGSAGKEVRRLWPVHGFRRAGWTTTEWAAWPFWRRKYTDDGVEFGRYTWVPPFFRHVQRTNRRSGASIDKTMLWPLARWGEYAEGRAEVAVPAPLPFDGPITRQAGRGIRPFISLYWATRDPDGTREVTAAFGGYQRRTTPDSRKVRLLWGLVGWDRQPDGRRYLRLLWGLRFRLGARR